MDNQELKKLVPHGYIQIIADKLGVHRVTVSNCLRGKTNSPKVEIAILETLAELKERKEGLVNLLNR